MIIYPHNSNYETLLKWYIFTYRYLLSTVSTDFHHKIQIAATGITPINIFTILTTENGFAYWKRFMDIQVSITKVRFRI